MAEPAASVLEVRDLKTVFRTRGGEIHAVNNVSFHLKPGELLGVVGESGSGKSVTMMSLLRLLPAPPADIRSGQVLLNGKDLLAMSDDQLRSVRGAKVGCYACHDGPDSENPTTDQAPVATSRTATASAAIPLRIALAASDPDGDPLELRIVDQPAHGSVAISGFQALLYPDAAFDGVDTFTFAAWDGKRESNLATVSLTIHDAGGLFADGVECGATTRWSRAAP